MKYYVLTTCNAAGWEQTGRRMAQSVIDRWPAEAMPLTVYAEGFQPDLAGIQIRRLPEWMAEFKAKHGDVRAHNGRKGARYDYLFDAVKFAHKVAAVTDFGLSLTDGVMVWLDVDTFTHAEVTSDWLASLFPAPAYIAWLDRQNTHIEAGFLMFRCDHPYHRSFMESFRNLYTSGGLFHLPGTTDCHALQHVVSVKLAGGKIEPPVSLSGDATRSHHPMVNGPISACMDHLKGRRKAMGRTPKEERRVRDGNPYWT